MRKRSAGVPVSAAVHRIIARGNAARERQDWERAAEAFRRALQVDPGLGHIWVQLGNAAKEHGLMAEAEAAYLSALQIRPDDAEPLLQLGHLLHVQSKHTEASKYYLRAFRRNPHMLDAAAAFQHILRQAQGLEREQIMEQIRANPPEDHNLDICTNPPHAEDQTIIDQCVDVVFDVSDLIRYFQHARLPTGIQRVQIEIITSALQSWDAGVGICCLLDGHQHWTEVPAGILRRIIALSLQNSDQNDPNWLGILFELQLQNVIARPFKFPMGAYLVNLGASWQVPDYFLFVRAAKAKYNIRYVPFVHDLIAVVLPDHFVKSALREFIPWVISVFTHADHFLVNSNATRRDLLQTGERLGRHVDPASIAVIKLDADFRPIQDGAKSKPLHITALGKWQVDGEPFVLLVSTVESRKGHAIALDAWAELIERHGADSIPKLVCAGKRGWLSDKVYQRLGDNITLASRVIMLSGVSDAELSRLYENCLFTLYPSLYEGWGLPVTESLCYAKPVIASNNSSLPEAGGDFAVYVDAGNSSALAAASERMIFDAGYREEIATRTRAEFHPRSWDDLANQIWRELNQFSEHAQNTAPVIPVPMAQMGAYHFLGRSKATRIWPGAGLGESFRMGAGWSAPEEAGSWTRPIGGMLSIGLPPRHRPVCIGLLLLGASACDVDWRVWIKDGPSLAGSLSRDGQKWITLTYPAIEDGNVLRLRLQSECDKLGEGQPTDNSDKCHIGLAGFFLHIQDDVESKMQILEAITLNNLEIIDAFRNTGSFMPVECDWDE